MAENLEIEKNDQPVCPDDILTTLIDFGRAHTHTHTSKPKMRDFSLIYVKLKQKTIH